MKRSNSTRRDFFLKGGAVLGAGAAGVAGASAGRDASAGLQRQLAESADREAIRQLHVAFLARVEAASQPGAVDTHRSYRSNAQQQWDATVIAQDGRRAVALWHVDVQVATPLEGDCTAAQMARLQGLCDSVRWESGRLREHYEKHEGQWRLASREYLS